MEIEEPFFIVNENSNDVNIKQGKEAVLPTPSKEYASLDNSQKKKLHDIDGSLRVNQVTHTKNNVDDSSDSSDLFENILSWIKNNPMILLLIASGLGLIYYFLFLKKT